MEKREYWGNLIVAFLIVYFNRENEEDKLFSRACCDRTRVKSFEPKDRRFRLDIRKKLIPRGW